MDLKALMLGLAFAAMWSSAFSSARIVVAAAPPLAALSLRFFLAGVLAVLIARMLGQTWRLTRGQWRATFLFGICQNALYLGLFFIAMQTVEASLAAIIASTLPLLVALAGWLLFRERIAPLAVAGLVAGFGGVALIMVARMGAGVDMIGVALCVLGVLALTVATLALRTATGGGNFLMVVGLQMFVGSIALAPFALAFEELRVDWSVPFVLAFLYQILVPGIAATLTWFVLVDRIGAVRASTFHFLNPFFGVAFAAILLGERLGPRDIVGVVIISAGILAVQMTRVRRQERRAARG